MTKQTAKATAGELRRAKALLDAIDTHRQKLLKDERSYATYWNADNWGSISGSRDAVEWIEAEMAKFIHGRMAAAIRRAVKAERERCVKIVACAAADAREMHEPDYGWKLAEAQISGGAK